MSSHRLALVAALVLGVLNVYVDYLHVRATQRAAIARAPPLTHYSTYTETTHLHESSH